MVDRVTGSRPAVEVIIVTLAKQQVIAAVAEQPIPARARLASVGSEIAEEVID